MTEHQRLFLVQARADFEVYELIQGRPELPPCHALHYLQMATEKLGKAHKWKKGLPRNTHHAFVGFLRSLSSNRQVQKLLGFENQNRSWLLRIRSSVPLAERIENLAPSLSPDTPNPEYPWPRDDPHTAPAEHNFDVWRDLQKTAAGHQFLHLLSRLFALADAYL